MTTPTEEIRRAVKWLDKETSGLKAKNSHDAISKIKRTFKPGDKGTRGMLTLLDEGEFEDIIDKAKLRQNIDDKWGNEALNGLTKEQYQKILVGRKGLWGARWFK